MKYSMKFFVPLALTAAAAMVYASTFNVQWGGALRAVHGGDTSGKVALDQFRQMPNLYAVGPVAGLDGEITAYDGKLHISRVRHHQVTNDSDYSGKASFLVWAQIKAWAPIVNLTNVATLADIDERIEKLAKKEGVDTSKPFPFLVEGQIDSLKYHVLVPKLTNHDASQSGHSGGHADNAKNIELKNASVKLVGFYSNNHEGVFTHKGSKTHLHVIEANGNTGHVDELAIRSTVNLTFPK